MTGDEDLTAKQAAQVTLAIRHLGRAMKALERAKLPHPHVGGRRWTWLLDNGHRALLEASDKLIDGMEAADTTETDLPSAYGDPT